MNLILKVLLFACLSSIAASSKLNLPRVLLPLFKSSSTNFTLKVTNNGCYTWTLSRLDIIQLIPVNLNKELDCSSEVILTTITKEFIKNTVIVLVEEVTTKEVLRCDVIVDVISSLQIFTKTRQLFVEESPVIFEVKAYDDQGNDFSTLEGVEFIWTVNSGSPYDASGKNDVLRFINFKDSLYEIPDTIRDLDAQGLKGHIVLLEGVKTGTANVSVELSQHEYRRVPPATVQLNVIANLLIEPSDTYILQGDVIYYKLLQVKNARFLELPLPSNQYSLIIEDETVARQLRPWVIEALSVGQTKIILSDVNSKTSNVNYKNYLPSVTLNVVAPAYLNLVALPHNSWVTVIYQPSTIVAELYDGNNHKIHIGAYPVINMKVDKKYRTMEITKNGSAVTGYPNEKGVIHVEAEFKSVRNNENVVIPFTPLHAEADLFVFDPLAIYPPIIRIPWDPVESPKLGYPLSVKGGDGLYQWSVADTQIAVVTQSGTVKPRSLGHTKVTVALPKNPALQASAEILVESPSKLSIVGSSIESEIDSPIYLAIALYYPSKADGARKLTLFSNCTGFPFEVKINNENFRYNSTSHIVTPSNACATIAIIGRVPGNAVVTVSYKSDGLMLKDTATVTAYPPLRVLSPDTGKTVLSVGAQRYVVFVGGPSRNSVGHKVVTRTDENVIAVKQTYDGIENERIFLVTCQTLGKGYISVEARSLIEFEGLVSPPPRRVDVICSHPKTFSLSADLADTKLAACPSLFRDSNVVLNSKPIVVRVTVKDDEGNVFDNATSLDVKWTLSNAELGEIKFQDVIKLREENKAIFTLPLYHYQIIEPNLKSGDLVVTANIMKYKKSWLKRLSINWEDKTFKIDDLQQSLTLTLVENVRVSPKFASIFNHPQNPAKFQISHGSGFYNVSSSAGNAAQINYSEITKSVEVLPYLPGTFQLMVKDECLNSEPITAEILILTISQINVLVQDKVEKGKSVTAYLTLIDSENNVVTKKDLFNLKIETDTNAVSVDCENMDRGSRVACTVNGVELGHANVVFTSGLGDTVVRSKPVRIQVYPPLQISPRNITLIPGASIQLTAKGGPQPHCVIEFTVKNGIVKIDAQGNMLGKDIGQTYVTGSAVEIKGNGEKIIYSSDTVHVDVVYLEGIRIETPLATIKSDAKMPVWISGVPEQVSTLILGSLQPPLSFKWDVSSPDVLKLNHIFEDIGVKISDTHKISMNINSLKKGNAVISVNVTAPRSLRNLARDGRNVFADSVSIKVFDELKVIDFDSAPLLLPPNINYNLKTNKDKVARISISYISSSPKRNIFELNGNGLISTSNIYGTDCVTVSSIEEDEFIQSRDLCIEIAPLKYIMLNALPELRVDPESSVFGLPRGIRLSFEITYHDNYGRRFAPFKNNVKYQLNKIDKVRVFEGENNELNVDLLDYGDTLLKLYSKDASLFPDFVEINTVSYIQPDKTKLVVGDVVCFNIPSISAQNNLCVWNSSNENALVIDKLTGSAVAKSEQTNVVISYQCPNNLKIVTTADVYALQKIEIISNKVVNVSNNGKRFVVPLRLINRADDLDAEEKNRQFTKHCAKEGSRFFPYECEIKFDDGSGAPEVNTVFKTFPNFDFNLGHSCVIESQNISTPQLSKLNANVILKVTWGRYHSATTSIPFKPALFLDTSQIVISDEKTTDNIRLVGLPPILSHVQILPSDPKFIAVKEETTGNENIAKYSVYVKPAFLKNTCPTKDLSISIISELTEQHMNIPISVNVDAERYSVPVDITDKVNQFVEDYWFRIIVLIFIFLITYFTVVKMYYKMDDNVKDYSMRSMDMSRNQSHLSDHSSPGMFRRHRSSMDQVHLIYGRSPERISRMN